jgi:hypothetical protein
MYQKNDIYYKKHFMIKMLKIVYKNKNSKKLFSNIYETFLQLSDKTFL